jgi:hypothetical protein
MTLDPKLGDLGDRPHLPAGRGGYSRSDALGMRAFRSIGPVLVVGSQVYPWLQDWPKFLEHQDRFIKIPAGICFRIRSKNFQRSEQHLHDSLVVLLHKTEDALLRDLPRPQFDPWAGKVTEGLQLRIVIECVHFFEAVIPQDSPREFLEWELADKVISLGPKFFQWNDYFLISQKALVNPGQNVGQHRSPRACFCTTPGKL